MESLNEIKEDTISTEELRNTDTVKEMHDIVSNLNEQTSLLEKHL